MAPSGKSAPFLLVFLLVLLFLLTFVFAQFSSSSSTDPSSMTLDQFMDVVASDLGKTHADIAPYTQKLKDEWFTSVDSLRYITDDKWTSMGFPSGLVSAIRNRLNLVCSTRSDCSDHGDCINNHCKCDPNWIGDRCTDKTQCTTPCQHGGYPSDDCTRCLGCRGGWTGQYCSQWDSSVPPAQLVSELQGYANDSIAYLKSIDFVRPLPGKIGVGVDITTGQFRLPVVKLTYTDPSKTWTNSQGVTFREPVEASFVSMPTGIYQPQLQSMVFTSMSQFVDHMYSWSQDMRSGIGGLFSHSSDLNAVYNRYFTGNDLLTVTQQYYPLFKLVLPDDPNTNAPNYQLDVHAQRALDALPPDYSTDASKQAYRTFVENWGTSFTTTAILGGIAELQTYFSSSLLADPVSPLNKPYTVDQLAQQANLDFARNTGGNGRPDQGYMNNRKLGTTDCFGGDPTKCGADKLSDWSKTIEQDPVAIMYILNDNGALIKDPAKRSGIQQAIHAYVAEMEDKIKNHKTCPICTPYGTCTPPSDTCTCTSSRITGRTCDRCIPGYSGSDCTVPVCSPACAHGTCVSPNTCSCAAHWIGATCNQCENGWTGSNCQTPVCSPACVHGTCVSPNKCNCQDRWVQPTCSACIEGWHGPDCKSGQKCVKCGGSGKVCNSAGCNFGYVTCNTCGGTGVIADNLQACFRCSGQGTVCNSAGCTFGKVNCPSCGGSGTVSKNVQRCFRCSGQGTVCNSAGCTYGTVNCPACAGKGNIPASAMKCPKCYGQGTMCNSAGCNFGTVTCSTCRGNGYI